MDYDKGDYWFAAKRYGWGWGLPMRWQGWVVMGLFLATVIADGVLFASRQWLIYGTVMALAAAALVTVCWWKGEPARWRWGE